MQYGRDHTWTTNSAVRAPNPYPFQHLPVYVFLAWRLHTTAKAITHRQSCLGTEANQNLGLDHGLNDSSKTGLLWATPRVLAQCKRNNHARGSETPPREPMKPPRVS